VTPPPPDDDDPGIIERLDTGEPPRSAEEAQARAPYERLLERIRDLEDVAPSPGWEDRAAARWASVRARRRAGIAVGVTAAVGLAVAIVLRPCAAPTTGLQVSMLAPPGVSRRGDHVVGDVLHVRAPLDRPHVELRVYLDTGLDTRLVVRCPGDESCRRDASFIELDWTSAEPGRYQVVVLSSESDIPPPVDRTSDRDLLVARNAGVRIEIQTVPVGQ
jgi:hypothetical protein